MNDLILKILADAGVPDLPEVLEERLRSSELNSLLLAVFDRKTARLSPPELLRQYSNNRLVKPCDLDPVGLKEFELAFFKIFRNAGFAPVELSPVSPLGACSVIGTVDQKKIVSALRQTEVLADATNAIALHICHLKKNGRLKEPVIRFSAIERHLRAQPPPMPGFTAHFKVGCLVSSGRDTGHFQFEKESLSEHIQAWQNALQMIPGVAVTRVKLQSRDGYPGTSLVEQLADQLAATFAGLEIMRDLSPDDNRYYRGMQFKLMISVQGREVEIADGGFVDWPQQLLQNRKERMLCSGLGIEFLYRLLTT